MSNFELNAVVRNTTGTGASRRLRRVEDMVPGIIYGGNKQAVSVAVSHKDIFLAIQDDAFFSHVINLKVDGKEEKVLLKDLQRHHYKQNRIVHVDFQRVSATDSIHKKVPIHFLNEEKCVGKVKEGGTLAHLVIDLDVKCQVKDLPEFIAVDVANLEMGKSIHISEIVLPKGVVLHHPVKAGSSSDLAVVSVHAPHKQEEEEVPAAVEAAPEATAEATKAKEEPKDKK